MVIYPLFLGSPLELGVIFLVVLILFGPGKLPEVFRSLGEGVKQFKDAANGASSPDPKTAPALPSKSENPPEA